MDDVGPLNAPGHGYHQVVLDQPCDNGEIGLSGEGAYSNLDFDFQMARSGNSIRF